VPGFVPQNPHAPFGLASLDFEHLGELQLRQTRMREIEGNGDSWDAIGREPLVRQPVVRTERHAACGQLLVQLGDPGFQRTAFDPQIELAELQVQQLLIRERGQLLGANPAQRCRSLNA
jgi:hypothetical protein